MEITVEINEGVEFTLDGLQSFFGISRDQVVEHAVMYLAGHMMLADLRERAVKQELLNR